MASSPVVTQVSKADELRQFFQQFPEKKFKAGELVLELDAPLKHISYLNSGYVRQYAVSPEGDEFTHYIFKPGSFIPIYLALHRETNPFYFESITPVKLHRAPRQKLFDFLQAHPRILWHFTQRLTAGVNDLLFSLQSLVFGNSRQRLAAILYLMAQRFGQEVRSDGNQIQSAAKTKGSGKQEDQAQSHAQFCKHKDGDHLQLAPFAVTHQDLAFMTGLTRETVSIEMMKLKKEGLIYYRQQQICLLQPEKLKEISSLPFYR